MLTEAIMHDCVVKLLKNHDEESLECLCRLLTTIGRDLDFEKAKVHKDSFLEDFLLFGVLITSLQELWTIHYIYILQTFLFTLIIHLIFLFN